MIYVLVLLSGAAALSWETLWQLHAALAIGVSAMGAALALVATMGGMTLGSLLMGRFLSQRPNSKPGQLFAILEGVIGVSGLLLRPGFALASALDRSVWQHAPTLAPVTHLLSILIVLSPASIAMGATLPVFGRIAQSHKGSLAVLYGLNTAGAALGVLGISFAVLPALGIEVTSVLLAGVNLTVAMLAFTLLRETAASPHPEPASATTEAGLGREHLMVFVTGFTILGLEVTWFRALRAAFWSTTDSFAIMLAAVLVPLAAGASLGRRVLRRGISIEALMLSGGLAVLIATPLIERFDLFFMATSANYLAIASMRFAASLAVMGPAVAILGSVLPMALDRQQTPRVWSTLYALNTLGCVLGSLLAAWLILPLIGSERAAWLFGALPCVVAIAISSRSRRHLALGLCAAGLLLAVVGQSGVGRTRVQGVVQARVTQLLDTHEGPDATIAVADDETGDRVLFIDGFSTTSQGRTTHYMEWMGRLPMLLHPQPDKALVICFGTGQTANGVRNENPKELDIVDLNSAIFDMAHLFSSNDDVLHDARVTPIVMDGRAWLRRTDETYDVITLEPMPPNFAGVNALYSLEFYQLAAEHLRANGVMVQWLPLHLVSVEDAGAIVGSFQRVFPDALLWIDRIDQSGILLGRTAAAGEPLGRSFPGLARTPRSPRDLTADQVLSGLALGPTGIARWAELSGALVTDDNQLLAYGLHRSKGAHTVTNDHMARHFAVIRELRAELGAN
jgi:spermidine synthase